MITKNEFKLIAKKRGITDVRYSGNLRTMFLYGNENTLSASMSFFRNCLTDFIVIGVLNKY